ncbi:MAG: LysM peptidoglycan-binding domain-containing protein [Verrucomicrobia bacterium]|nr:LysM peptidoglycan-binding domain-containing protein [Verrucomicrobiota bacterium]
MPRQKSSGIALAGAFVYVSGMTIVPSALFRRFACVAAILLLAACTNFTGNPLDDESNPDFQAGKRRISALDSRGAIESFEKALQTNPNSAQSHFELGLLYEKDVRDYGSAIYHFQKYMKLRPESNVSDMVLGRINSCKVELAKTVSFSLVSKNAFAEMTRLANENAALREQVMQLNMQIARTSPVPPVGAIGESRSAPPQSLEHTARASPAAPLPAAPATSPRTHPIQRNETFFSLSRKYGVTVAALKAANPTVVPERLKVGQAITIPPAGN